jgi:hypothetical protein
MTHEKKKQKDIVVFVGLSILLVLVWAPWMNSRRVHDFVLTTYGARDGSIQDGKIFCDYSVVRVPFGRWVASCEGGYFVPFWKNV